MPPYYFSAEEQTKQWATNTIDSLFSDNQPISFEPIKPIEREQARPVSHLPARRSLSVLEARLFNRHHDDENGVTKDPNGRVRPWTTSFVSDNNTYLLTAHNQKSISSRLRRSLTLDKPNLNKKMLTIKEDDGIDIWKNTFLIYLTDSNMVSSLLHIFRIR
jgi:hypothetical protein